MESYWCKFKSHLLIFSLFFRIDVSYFFNVWIFLGLIIFHARHKNAKGPIHMVHAENWLVYCLYNTKSRRYELTVLEMYDGYTERNR